MSFKNVILGTQHKSYTHDLSFDNNTTMDFGVIQPLLSQYMFPNSTIKVSSKQLVRLAPMPTPSFARMYLANYASFVKMTDVVPYHESLLSQIPFATSSKAYQPTQMPFINNRYLMYLVLQYSFASYYQVNSTSPYQYDYIYESAKVTPIIAAFASEFLPHSLSTTADLYPKFKWNEDQQGIAKTRLTPLNADFVLTFGTNDMYMICFKFSDSSLRLRKVFRGLGYSLDFEDVSHISIAPILAFYKAYYDRFGLVRDIPFESTTCFKIIKLIEDYTIDFTINSASTTTASSLFWTFVRNELADLWYTSADSYIAAQRHDLTNATPSRKLLTLQEQNGLYTSQSVPTGKTTSKQVPYIGTQGNAYFTQLSLDVLKRLSTFINKDSVIGKRMSDWVRVHYGAEVSNSLFEQSSRINEWRTNISIDDVFSTSDTADIGTKDKGEFLGSYAGKGSGFSNSGFSYKAPVHGFVFVMSCIVPVANIFQGNDPTLLAVDLDTIPQPEFDALGFEATPRSVFFGANGIYSDKYAHTSSQTFGFVPRYTGFKCKKNIVNGDMIRGYFSNDLLPYFNDRIFYNKHPDVNVHYDDSGVVTGMYYKLSTDLAPNATTEYQKICKYASMGDYDRLFYNKRPTFSTTAYTYPYDDNFIVQTVFDVKVSNFLKPVRNSYDTVDDVDNNTTPVSSI